MRPDGTDRFSMHDTVVPMDGALTADPELAALDAELERAAARVRGGRRKNRRERPSAAFAAALRRRLMSQAATVVRESPAAARSAQNPTSPAIGPLPGTAERPLRPPTWQRTREAEVETVNAPRPVAPVIAARTPTILPAPRWTVLAIAAALLVAAVGLRSSLQLPVAPSSRAGDVAGATLLRDGIASSLTAGVELREGDEISVADGGHATIEIGAGQTRLAPRASVRIERLAADRTVLDQLAGRAFHRVVVGSDASYIVRTAGISWTATGTAFDLDRSTIPGGERLELVAVEHDVVVDGPSLRATVAEGRRAVVLLGPGSPDLTTGSAGATVLTDPWLVANARRDLALGFPLGIMTGLDLAEATPTTAATTTPPVEETAAPTASPAGEPAPTPPATPSATPRPTPRPTPKPTPTPAPTPATLAMTLTSCNGGVVVDWSAYGGGRFHHYAVLRNSGPSIPAAWPPQAGSQLLDGSKTTDRTKTSIGDAGADGGSTRWYRALALDSANRVLAIGPVRSGSPAGVANLGELSVAPQDAGTQFGWSPYGGGEACFDFYKLVYSAEDSTPSYLEGATPAWVGSDRAAGGTWLAELPSGTYWFRLQAIRTTDLGKFVVAETSPTAYTVP